MYLGCDFGGSPGFSNIEGNIFGKVSLGRCWRKLNVEAKYEYCQDIHSYGFGLGMVFGRKK